MRVVSALRLPNPHLRGHPYPHNRDGLANLLNGIRLLVECGDREGTVIALGYAHRLTKVLGGERA